MSKCEEAVYSEQYLDFIIEEQYLGEMDRKGMCIQKLEDGSGVVYYPADERETGFESGKYAYNIIPRCFGLLNNIAMEDSGITKVRDRPDLSLTGQGVLMGFIDTDFDYMNPLFCHCDGTTRVLRIWNQQDRTGRPPEGFIYGSEYTNEQIDGELLANRDQMTARIPCANGHGTFLAALAAGARDPDHEFCGAAPQCDIAFVQLKPAKKYLKDFYFIPEHTPAFQENDIMAGICYLNHLAARLKKPLSLCIALGTNMGNRGGRSPVSRILTGVSECRQRCVSIAAGNEADKRHHFLGSVTEENLQERVEISVSEGVEGFIAELWAKAPDRYQVDILSPAGERFHAVPTAPGSHCGYRFIFEHTYVTVDYLTTGDDGGSSLVYIRFRKPVAGIWVLTVTARSIGDGRYHVWLPMSEMISGEAVFLHSNPDTTLTVPSDCVSSITVAGYNSKDGGIYPESGRGYTAAGEIKPDIAAPAVDIYGPTGQGKFETRSGTSVAAAIAAGAGALMLEWTGVRHNDETATTAEIKNYLIRGAVRDKMKEYPDREWGWGQLDLCKTFENFRNV